MSSSSDSYEDIEDNIDMLASHDDFQPEKLIETVFINLFNSLFSDTEYGSSNYWEERYKKEDSSYDWFLEWNDIYPFVSSYLSYPIHNCLNIGAGNSTMSSDMLSLSKDIQSVMSIDISDIVIKQMKEKYKDEKRLLWETMDCTKLCFPNDSFDFVVDKGTIDALYCCKDFKEKIEQTVKEIQRVLKKQSVYICISYGNEEVRKDFIEISKKSLILTKIIPITHKEERKGLHYAYVFTKQ